MGQNISLPKISIVMRNQNKFSLTSDCIKSLEKLTYPNYIIIVVDDGSADDSPERLKESFPEIILIRNKEHLGYCKANNIGIKKALEMGARYVFLVNNDTKDFSQNYFEETIKVFERDNLVGLVGTEVVDFKGNKVWWGQNENKLGVTRNTPDCGFIIKAGIFEKIGFFDEALFRYFEDLDFIVRLRKAGYKTAFIPIVKFAHLGGGTTSGVGFVFHYYRVRNIFLFIKKHGSEMKFFHKLKYFTEEITLHIKTIGLCLLRRRIRDFLKVTGFVFRGIISGLTLFFKK